MEIYLSHHESDLGHAQALRQVLKPVLAPLGLTIWGRKDLVAGSITRKEVSRHLENARLFVALVSTAYLASDLCEEETKRALRLQYDGQLLVVAVLVSPCLFDYSLLNTSIVLPQSREEIVCAKNRDKVWIEVQMGLLEVIKNM